MGSCLLKSGALRERKLLADAGVECDYLPRTCV